MKHLGKYRLEVVRDQKTIYSIDINNTITNNFLEHMTQVFSGNISTLPKYAGFGLGNGTSEQSAFFLKLDNELLRVGIDTYSNVGSGVLTTQTIISSTTLENAGISNVTEVGVFCVNDTDDEATVSTTINTGTLVSRIRIDVDIEDGDAFILKRTDTLIGG